MQTLRRAVLGQTRQPPNYPINPTDTVLPVYYFDDTPLLRNCVECWTLRFHDPLDAEMLRESLSRVLVRPGWRKLGGRIRMSKKEKLEIHVPEAFTPERPALGFHHDVFDVSIDEHPLASTLPQPTPGRLSLQAKRSEFASLGVPAGTPLSIGDYIKSDHPQLTLHVVSFTDATLVSLCWPHIAVDAMSLRDLGVAWSLVLAGRESGIPPMLSAGEDPMARAGYDLAFTKPHVLENQVIKGWRMWLFAIYYIFELLWWRTIESRAVFLPRKNVQKLRDQALASLTSTSSPPPFISEGDVVAAWLTVMVSSAVFPKGTNRSFRVGNAYDLRGRAPSLFPDDKGAYVQNAVFPTWTSILARSMNSDDALGIVALAIRNSIIQQTTEAMIHAQARLTREFLEYSGIPPMYGDASAFTCHFTNWSKANFFEAVNFEPAIISKSSNRNDAKSSARNDEWEPAAPGHPVYYHIIGVSPNNMLSRNASIISRTPGGDYWINGNYPPEVWKLIESTT
ncbi:hypothetical protein NW762_011533 [Fusarium torreyae]|uniref:Lysr family regulatory protein n=1 Tax=Fusarium torreyae TaxID=1237075 RepID=A0A9W8VAM0_9HYPO|nr:hypothetical protein NW762_011533 [Fusarium torreyae]